jgi:hypothetical protein
MSILSVVSSRIIAAATLGALQMASVLAAEKCFPKPDLRITSGGHWYYYSDTEKNRKCWFLRQDVERQTSPSTQSSTGAGSASKTQSLLSSLASTLSPASERDQGHPLPSDSYRHSATRQPQAVSNNPMSKQPSKLSERLSAPRSAALDRATRDALFSKFLFWKEKQSTVHPKLDYADRDALFREFLVWSERQHSVEQ